jgi:hypothetical protein
MSTNVLFQAMQRVHFTRNAQQRHDYTREVLNDLVKYETRLKRAIGPAPANKQAIVNLSKALASIIVIETSN